MSDQRFKHDCPEDIYLGQHKVYDLYLHAQNGNTGLIARWGGMGWEYGCVMAPVALTVLRNHEEYAVIVERATQKGICVEVKR